MPELSRFRGIRITINFNDHPPAHIHIRYGGMNAMVDIERLAVSEGYLPARVRQKVIEWATIHQQELRIAWAQRRDSGALRRIPPLE